jgi:hypothetical protein
MKLHRDLIVSGDPQTLEQLRDRLSETPADWPRSAETEARAVKQGLGTPTPFVFEYTGEAYPGVKLWLFWKGDRAEVTNIVPTVSSELTHDEYNGLAADFAERVLKPATDALGLAVVLGTVSTTFDQECSPRVLKALRAFSVGANKSTLNAHPMDAERWRTFVVLAHNDSASMDSELLADWLHSDDWSADAAWELSSQYHRGRELLRAYDEHIQ